MIVRVLLLVGLGTSGGRTLNPSMHRVANLKHKQYAVPPSSVLPDTVNDTIQEHKDT